MRRALMVVAALSVTSCFNFEQALDDCIAGRFCLDPDGGVSMRDAGVRDAGTGDSGVLDSGVQGLPVGATCSMDETCATGRCEGGRCAIWAFPIPGVISGSLVTTPGNLAVLVGSFGRSLDLGAGPLTSTNRWNAFIARRTSTGAPEGGPIIGAPAVSDQADLTIEAAVVDGTGALVVVGRASAVGQLGGKTVPRMDNSDVFAARVDLSTQTVLWVTGFGGLKNEVSPVVAVDGRGEVYVTGWTQSDLFRVQGCSACPVDFPIDNPAPAGMFAGPFYSFVARLDRQSGNPVWVRFLGPSDQRGFVGSRAMAFSAIDDSVVVGGSAILDVRVDRDRSDAGLRQLAQVGEDGFLTKLSAADGTAAWLRVFGGGSNDSVGSLVIDPAGSVYASGLFDSSGAPAMPPITAFADRLSPFLLKLDKDNTPVWMRLLPAAAPLRERARNDQPLVGLDDQIRVVFNPSGGLVLSGCASQSVSLDGLTFVGVPDGGPPQHFLLPLSTDNVTSPQKALRFQATTRAAVFPAFAPNGNLFLSGVFEGSLTLPLDGGVLDSGDAGVRAGFAASLGRWP